MEHNNNFSAFPKLSGEEIREHYNYDNSDIVPAATSKQKAYITTLLEKKGLDMFDLFQDTGKDIDELSINEASDYIKHLKSLKALR